MVGRLEIVTGPDQGLVIALHEGQAVILGRGQIIVTGLRDPGVAPVHCQVQVGPDGATLADAGTAPQGTLVNGQRLAGTRALQPGDVIALGGTQVRFVPAGGLQSTRVVPLPSSRAVPPAPPPRPVAAAAADDSEPPHQPTQARPPRPSGGYRPVLEPGQSLAALVGQCLARYQVEKVLARGQSGMIFRARDFERDRVVALKVLNPEFSQNEEEMQRFVRAMKTMLPLCHPNLVTLYGAGRVNNLAWVAMEYIEGESLAEIIKKIGTSGMLDWRISLRLAIHLAHALAYAHQQNILHRNLTPPNVLVRKQDRVAKLGDLMQVKALEGTLAVQLTRPGHVVGHLPYAAPETLENSANADHRSDIYALGALVYAVLTGRPPIEGSSLADVFVKIRTNDPPPPRKFQPNVPEHFEGAVRRMLAKRPEERFQSTVELLELLESIARFQGLVV